MIIGDIETKVAFADATRGAAASLIQALERLHDLQATYLARGYQPGGADAIVDSDIITSKITASQLSQFIDSAWLTTKLLQVMNEQTVTGTIQGYEIVYRVRGDV